MAPAASAVSSSNAVATISGPDGVVVAQSGHKLGFFGTASPVVQPSDNAQAALTRGLGGGWIATYSSTQSPAAVAQGTTAEQTLTIQAGTGFTMQLATGDILYVNKPTQQAGLGYGNCRVSSANTLGISFINVPAGGGNITPTGSEAYKVVAVRGLPSISAVLSPAAVAANTTVEQQFNVTGLPAGYLVQVSKPTVQAGLDIVGCRVVSSGVLGITFCNVTASPITPTASQTYTIGCLAGLDAIGNEIMYGFHVGTVGAIGAGVVATGGATTLTGLLASDAICSVTRPTAQAAATNAAIPAYGIPTADTLTLHYFGVGTGYTPTASEVYAISTRRMAPVAPLTLLTATITPTSVASATTAEQTFTVTGLVAGSAVWINPQAALTTGIGIAGVRVSATDTLAITFINTTSGALVPAAFSALVGSFQVKAPGANNCVYQAVSPVVHTLGNLANAIRSALANTSFIAGS